MDNYSLKTKFSWSQILDDIAHTMSLWEALHWETNTPRGSHMKSSDQSLEDRRAILKYTAKDGRKVVLQMDKQDRAVDNLRVLYMAVEALRMNEKRGIADVVKTAYLQLEAPPEMRDPYEVLEVREGASLAVAEAAYKIKAKELHADAGGSDKEMKILNVAIETIRNLNK